MTSARPDPIAVPSPGRLERLSASPLAGPLYVVMAAFVFSLGDTAGKHLTLGYSVFLILLFRGGSGIAVLLPLLWRGGLAGMRPANLGGQIALGVAHTGAMWTFFMALRTLTLPDATAVGFASPIVATLIAIPLLRERVRMRQWIAIGAGFAGVLVMVRPGGALDPLGVGYMIGCVVCYSTMVILFRAVGHRDNATMTSFWTSLVMCAAGLIAVPAVWTTPSAMDLGLFLVVGLTGVLAQTLMAAGLRRAPVSVVAPLDYTYVIFIAFLSWMVFDETFAQASLIGGPVVIGASLYLAFQRRADQHA